MARTERGDDLRTASEATTQDLREAYLYLLKRTLTRSGFPRTPYRPISANSSQAKSRLNHLIQSVLHPWGLELVTAPPPTRLCWNAVVVGRLNPRR